MTSFRSVGIRASYTKAYGLPAKLMIPSGSPEGVVRLVIRGISAMGGSTVFDCREKNCGFRLGAPGLISDQNLNLISFHLCVGRWLLVVGCRVGVDMSNFVLCSIWLAYGLCIALVSCNQSISFIIVVRKRKILADTAAT